MSNRIGSLRRPDLLQTAVVSFATVVALVIFGWVLAYWTWQWFAPRTTAPIRQVELPAGHIEAAGDMFGKRQGDSATATTAINLFGIIASQGSGPGYAILRFEGHPIRALREGEQIEPGIRLAEIHPDRITVEHSGLLETVILPTKKANIDVPVSPSQQQH